MSMFSRLFAPEENQGPQMLEKARDEFYQRQPKPEPDSCLYFVGRTQQGKTALRIQSEDGSTHMTLAMNDYAVREMIRLLEASVTVEPEKEENEDL